MSELSISPPHLPNGKLAGAVAIITGAGSGIGAETARIFHAEGAHVVLTDLNGETVEAVAAELVTRVSVLTADITDEARRIELVELAREANDGRIDVLVNSAGATIRGTIDETTTSNAQSAFEVNLAAAIHMTRLVAPGMRDRRRGSIVNVASITSLQGIAGAVAYSASKAGLVGATRSIALELAPFAVRVNAVCPGVVDSPMTHSHVQSLADPQARYEELKRRQPMGRLASARDCALANLFLASDDSSFVTGAAIPVDGGRHAT